MLQCNEKFDVSVAVPLGLLAAINRTMIGLGLLNPQVLLTATQNTLLAHLFQAQPDENMIVQGSDRIQVIHVLVAILAIYHHQTFPGEPLDRGQKDWQVKKPDTANDSVLTGRLPLCNFLTAGATLHGQKSAEKGTKFRDENR